MNASSPVKLGVIGCGVIGQKHVQMAAEAPAIDVVAVADLRADVARDVAARFHVATVYNDAEALLADARVEAVVLALPACDRTRLALRAFEQGKHVLTEKPVAMDTSEVRQLIRARGDLIAGCCSSRFHFYESARIATSVIGSGVLGALRFIRCRAIKSASEPPTTPPPVWRLKKALNGGGIMANWGCYDLDYLLGVTGWSLRPTQVQAQTWTVPPALESHVAPGSDAETHVAALIRCVGGPVIMFERGEYVASQTEEVWQITGDRGSLRLRMVPDQPRAILHDEASTERGVVTRTIWEGDEDTYMIFAGPVLDFAAAIRERRQPQTSLERALIVQQITDAIYASAEQGVAIDITEQE
jgi:predicted dehydrogenase